MSEFAVLLLFLLIVFLVLGVVALVLGFRAPAEKHALAVELEWRGAVCLGIAAVMAFCFWLYRRLVD